MSEPSKAEDEIRQLSFSRCAEAVTWLRAHKVPARDIATAFGVKEGYVRKLVFTWLNHKPKPRAFLPHVLRLRFWELLPQRELAPILGIRADVYTRKLRSREEERLQSLRDTVESCFSVSAETGRFVEAAKLLAKINLGRPAESHLIGLKALLCQYIAWLNLHSGYSRSAVEQASKAMLLYSFAACEPDSKLDAQGVTGSALIAAHGLLMRGQLELAKRMLGVCDAVFLRARNAPTADYYRQKAILLWYSNWYSSEEQVKLVRATFLQAIKLVPEERRPIAKILRQRHVNILDPDYERASENLAEIRERYGAASLRYCLNAHWTAAVGLMGTSSHLPSRNLIIENWTVTRHFADLSLLSRLLLATPELPLSAGLRRAWIKYALYHHGSLTR